MRTIEVDWAGSHEAGDDADFVMQMLEAGYDDGPLIVLPWASRPAAAAGSGSRSEVFKDVSHYIAHLAMHADAMRGERWVGLVRSSERENEAPALAAMLALRRATMRRPRRRPPSSRRPPEPVFDYQAYSDDPGFTGEVRITHVGEFVEDVRRAFPGMPEGRIVISSEG